jgi:hypothetical protein
MAPNINSRVCLPKQILPIMERYMTSQLAQNVSQVPKVFEATNKSTACILKDFGFPDTQDDLTVDEVEDILRRDPHLADLWFERASDQRLSGGWGIEADKSGFRVQSYSNGHCLHHHDRCRACAEFVVRYVKFIGDVIARRR